ncbi:hypothetical protein [Anaerotruncus colihominis]|uniref:hypothetical protein n=1 Tax=Anaerotruncus colihominis TaxID=169435 RepID=UPI0024325E31|nr:hypothetical protein [Anaerotruncus colihominis]
MIDNKRLPYSEIKDIVYSPATAGKSIKIKRSGKGYGRYVDISEKREHNRIKRSDIPP